MKTTNLGLTLAGSGTFPGSNENMEIIDERIAALESSQGVAGREIQTVRAAVTFLKNTQAEFTVMFPKPFADADFTATGSVEFPDLSPDKPGQVSLVDFKRLPTNDGVVIEAKNISNTDFPGLLHIIAIHD